MGTAKKQHKVPALRFSEFSDTWEVKTLGDCFEVKSASRVHKDEWTKAGVPFFRSSDVVSNYKGEENNKAFISHKLYTELSEKSGRVAKGDLLVTGGGSIGIPYLINSNDPLYFKDADLLWFRNGNSLNSVFLYSYLRTEIFRRYLKSISHIGTISHYTIEQAKSTPISLPKLSEQQKIADFLGSVDDWLDNLRSQKTALESYKRGMMQKLFTQQARFKDDAGKDFSEWEKKELGQVFNAVKGSGISKEQLNANGSNECILYGELYTKYSEQVFEVKSKTNVTKGTRSNVEDLLVPCSTTTTAIDLANVTALNKKNVLLGGDITVLRGKDKVSSIFYAYYLSNHKKRELAKYGQGVTIIHIYYSHFKDMIIGVPSLPEQQKIANFLTSLDKGIESKQQQIAKAEEWKKGLMQKMFV